MGRSFNLEIGGIQTFLFLDQSHIKAWLGGSVSMSYANKNHWKSFSTEIGLKEFLRFHFNGN